MSVERLKAALGIAWEDAEFNSNGMRRKMNDRDAFMPVKRQRDTLREFVRMLSHEIGKQHPCVGRKHDVVNCELCKLLALYTEATGGTKE